MFALITWEASKNPSVECKTTSIEGKTCLLLQLKPIPPMENSWTLEDNLLLTIPQTSINSNCLLNTHPCIDTHKFSSYPETKSPQLMERTTDYGIPNPNLCICITTLTIKTPGTLLKGERKNYKSQTRISPVRLCPLDMTRKLNPLHANNMTA